MRQTGDDLHIHAMPAVLYRVVRLVRADPVDGDQGAVNDDVGAFTEAGEGFIKAGRPGSQNVQGVADVPPSGGLGYPEAGSELRERFVLAQMDKGEQCLLEAAELASACVAGPAVFVKQPGNMLDELMRDVERGRIRNQQGPFGRRCVEWNHHANDEGPCLVTTPAD
ncbi:hypothetical protein SVTN_33900 [Streptomyces vietnamensis]|uniref:Uncharacterized protein n=1 Tax=Streptomyces vietnamensis TaxID=362257 RepID=A0A0B5IJL0_9ACTN|nr:hypothetical protein SVTN_33900 [Streptomyces vietnamensis]